MEELERLVERAQRDGAERHAAFGELVRRFQDLAYGCALAVLGDGEQARDAAQEAFVTAWQELASLRTPAAFPGWFRRIVQSRCHRLLRMGSVSTAPLEAAAEVPDSKSDPQAELERGELRREVRTAIGALPEGERMVTTLFYIGEYSQKEIAAFLELPLTTIQKRLYSARKRLRVRLEARLQDRSLIMVQDNLRENRPSQDDRFARTVALFNAVGMGDAERVGALLAEDSTLLRERRRGQWGDRTPLHLAAERGNAEITALLLAHGAEVNARDEGDNATPLHWAAGEGHLEPVRLLVEAGAELNATDDMHERGPLGWATVLGELHLPVAEYLIERGARMDVFAAMVLGRPDRVRELAAADSETLRARMSLCEDYQSPLHFAARKGLAEMADLLLDLGADPNARTPTGRTPLCAAVEAGHPALGDHLRERGATVDLLSAIALDHPERANELLDAGVAPEERNQALVLAAHYGRTALVDRLLREGADPNTRGSGDWLRGTTPLILAANGNHTGTALRLLEGGADATVQDEYPGATALHFAAWHGNLELGARLLAHGADLHLKDGMYHADPLGWAAENRQTAMIDFLIQRRSDVDISRAAFFGKLELVRQMLEAEPSLINFRGNYGTALHQAALHGRVELVRLLLEHGADLEALNIHGDTALTMVRKAMQGLAHPSEVAEHPEIERMLLAAGARE